MTLPRVRGPHLIRPALRAGNRNSLARLRRAAASSDWELPFCERGAGAPLSHSPPRSRGQRTEFAAVSFLRAQRRQPLTAPSARKRRPLASSPGGARHRPAQRAKPRNAHRRDGAQARERRPPVGTAARRAATAQTPTIGIAPFSARTPQWQDGARQRSAGLRPASRGSAKPARMTLLPANALGIRHLT